MYTSIIPLTPKNKTNEKFIMQIKKMKKIIIQPEKYLVSALGTKSVKFII